MAPVFEGTVKEEFNLLVQHVTEIQKSFIENTAKVAGFLLLAMGWLATANEARNFLSDNDEFAIISAISVAAAYSLSVWASSIAYIASYSTAARLSDLSYLPPSAYKGRPLGLATFLVCVIGNGVLTSLLITFLIMA